jgi:magnesium-transporting ATPase (P-type)
MELLAVTGWSLRQTGDGTGRMTAFAHVPSHISEHTHQAMSRPIDNSNKYDLCKHFEFTPDRLRAATILRRPDGSVTYLLKGSPEVIVRLCEASGTVPAHIEQTLVDIARRGLRVIAVAARECLPAVAKGDNSNAMRYSELMRMSQDDIERLPDMKFIGE